MDAKEKLQLLAKDLARDFPRSPREKLAGYVVAARTLDKCRAALNESLGDYHYDCPLDRHFFEFTGIDAETFKRQAATGATDAEMAQWIEQTAKKRSNLEIVKWNNKLRYIRISELPDEAQEFLEGYIDQFIPKNRPVYYWFDVYDIEEQRI